MVYKLSASHSHWLLVIGAADEVWMLVSFLSDCELKGNVVFCIIVKWITSDRTSEKVIEVYKEVILWSLLSKPQPLAYLLHMCKSLALKLTLLSWNLCSHNFSFLSNRRWLLARSPDDPQRIRVASVFEMFCVCLLVCLSDCQQIFSFFFSSPPLLYYCLLSYLFIKQAGADLYGPAPNLVYAIHTFFIKFGLW